MQYVVAALATASVYALIAMGITLIYGVARIMHVAHAIMFVLSSFLTYELVAGGWPFGWATLASTAAVTALGAVLYVLLFDRVRDRPYSSLVVSLGLVVLGEAVLYLIWGLDVFQIEGPLSGTGTFAGVSFTIGSVVAVLTAVVLVAGLAVTLRRTGAGRMVRAVAENPAAASLLGIRARLVAFVVFIGGTAMAALAGSLIGTFVPFSAASADVFVLKAFAIAIVGGLGSPLGAVAASVLFATVEIVPIALGYSTWSTPVLFLTMVVVLVLRPAGLFGTRTGHHGREDDALPAVEPVGTGRSVRLRGLGAVVGIIAVLMVVPLLSSSDSLVGLAAYAMCLAVAAYAVWVPLHYLGVPSLAHAALVGIGAYVAGVALGQTGVGIGPLLVYGALGAVVVAFALAVVAMRSDSLPASAIITLALGGLVVSLISNLTSVTGGISGLVVVKPLTIFGVRFGVADSDLPIYLLGLAVVAVVLVAVWAVEGSRFGASLLAVRDNAVLAEAVGMNTLRLKVLVFTASGALAGVAGVLYAYFSRFLEPATFDASLAINLLLAVLLGGSASKYGPLIGVTVFVFLPYVSPLTGPADLVLYGLVLIAFATFAPGGVPGLLAGLGGGSRGMRGHLHRPNPESTQWRWARDRACEVTIQRSTSGRGRDERQRGVDVTGPVLLEARGVTKSFGGVRALVGVDWTVRTGEIWGVVGPNGSGKTTFFNCLSGFHRLTGGSVVFDGADVSRHPMRRRARAGLVRTFQHAEVFGSLTVVENLVVAGRDTHRSRTERLASLHEVGLGPLADVPASALSFGKRRLLGVAMAAAMGPSLLLLDEPTSGLNDAESDELRAFLLVLNAAGLTIAVVDHHMDFLLPLCGHMLLLRSGERLWEGPPAAFARSEEVLSSYLGTGAS